MFYKNKNIMILLVIVFIFNLCACGKKEEVLKNEQINIYIGVKDKESLSIIKFLTDEYKKANPKVQLNINNAIGGKVEEDIAENSDVDVVFTSRNDMLKLVRKSLLSDMSSLYEKNNLSDRYYTVVKAYGRFNDRYYGIPVIPYTVEILCNKEAFNRLNLKVPSTISEVESTLKAFNSLSERVPVVLNEGMDINNTIFSIILNNVIPMRKLESIYDSSSSEYKKLSQVQKGFDTLENLVKSGYINKDTFEIGNESTIEKFNRNGIPMIIASSYYVNRFDNPSIECLQSYSLDGKHELKVPIMSDTIISIPMNNKNGDKIDDFIEFIFSDNTQKKLSKKGFVTGNKNANTFKEGIKKTVIAHLQNGTEDSIAFIYNIPENLVNNISSKIENILSGKYTDNEWNEVVDESY
ncbi:ABC transporter substrate-binding protein [Clostridium sp. WILCCON 0269]|uniref:ABC transporter substrate-binding protein n=1 Tax=Candidatus Clostridium eludens TaxID=3381663 RepID=A0ABW8SH69_9CLOT